MSFKSLLFWKLSKFKIFSMMLKLLKSGRALEMMRSTTNLKQFKWKPNKKVLKIQLTWSNRESNLSTKKMTEATSWHLISKNLLCSQELNFYSWLIENVSLMRSKRVFKRLLTLIKLTTSRWKRSSRKMKKSVRLESVSITNVKCSGLVTLLILTTLKFLDHLLKWWSFKTSSPKLKRSQLS